MTHRLLAALLLTVASLLAAGGVAAEPRLDARLTLGTGRFDFPFLSAGEMRTIPVWYHRPEHADANAPLVFVLHGADRNAQTYRKYWIPLAEQQGYTLLVPEFSAAQFPGTRSYNLGNVAARDGTRYPESQWSYTAIEDIFDAVRMANAFSAPTYDIYGHSAGGQFVHRMVFFKPDARYRVAIAANPGWYMMPDFETPYPYGLKGSGIDRATIGRAFTRSLIVLLGDRDRDPNHRTLSRTAQAMLQGDHRFARGQTFYEHAKRAATEMRIPFNWALQIAPGVAHSNARIAPYADQALAPKH